MIEQAQARPSRQQLDAWILANAGRAVAYARSLLRNPSQAEDVVQDCLCRLLQKGDVYDLPRDGVKLLFRSITNACINLTTRHKPLMSLDATHEDGQGPRWEAADRHTLEPVGMLIYRELEEAVRQGLQTLPVQQRAALELKSLGHSQQEIAEMLEVSVSNAGVLVHRARQAMAEYLAPYCGGAPT